MNLICRTWGHRYAPRFSVIRTESTDANGSNLNRRKIYEGDVCKRCGDTIDGRPPEDSIFDSATLSVPTPLKRKGL